MSKNDRFVFALLKNKKRFHNFCILNYVSISSLINTKPPGYQTNRQDETLRKKIHDEEVDRSQDEKIREKSHDERDLSSSNGVEGSYGR